MKHERFSLVLSLSKERKQSRLTCVGNLPNILAFLCKTPMSARRRQHVRSFLSKNFADIPVLQGYSHSRMSATLGQSGVVAPLRYTAPVPPLAESGGHGGSRVSDGRLAVRVCGDRWRGGRAVHCLPGVPAMGRSRVERGGR